MNITLKEACQAKGYTGSAYQFWLDLVGIVKDYIATTALIQQIQTALGSAITNDEIDTIIGGN